MADSKIYVGLEIGTSKTCMIVGESKPDGSLTIIGVGEVKSAGVRKGEIVDMALARQCVIDAWNLAQEYAYTDILSVYLVVTGPHIKGETCRGTFRLPEKEQTVTKEHMEEVCSIAQDLPISNDHFMIHSSKGKFIVDDNDMITHPEGLFANTLEVDYHMVYGTKSRIHNSLSCVRDVPLEVDAIVFAPIASGLALLESKDRTAGCLLIDIGGGTTDYCLYLNDQPVLSGCIPVGGDHITSDIHQICGIPMSRAEALKKTEGDASLEGRKALGSAKLPASGVLSEVNIPRAKLNSVIHERVVDTLLLVQRNLPREYRTGLSGGVFLTGGTSLLRGLGEVTSHVFKTAVYQPESKEVPNSPSYVKDNPRFSAVIGAIRFAQMEDMEKKAPPSLFRRIINWFR